MHLVRISEMGYWLARVAARGAGRLKSMSVLLRNRTTEVVDKPKPPPDISIGFLDEAFDDIVLEICFCANTGFAMQVLRCRAIVGDVSLANITYLYLHL